LIVRKNAQKNHDAFRLVQNRLLISALPNRQILLIKFRPFAAVHFRKPLPPAKSSHPCRASSADFPNTKTGQFDAPQHLLSKNPSRKVIQESPDGRGETAESN
jgi:hypothetical protein